MAMVVQHNITAMNSNRQLGVTTSGQAKSSEKLSSGYRINRAGDDAAGLKISEKMRSQTRGLSRASANAQDGVSLIQTAEGALNEVHSILQRMNELAVQGSNDTNQDIDRDAINQELTALTTEIDRIASTTQFNKQELLDGSFVDKKLHVGANTDQNIAVTIEAMNANAIGLRDAITLSTGKMSTGTAYSLGGHVALTKDSAVAIAKSAIIGGVPTVADQIAGGLKFSAGVGYTMKDGAKVRSFVGATTSVAIKSVLAKEYASKLTTAMANFDPAAVTEFKGDKIEKTIYSMNGVTGAVKADVLASARAQAVATVQTVSARMSAINAKANSAIIDGVKYTSTDARKIFSAMYVASKAQVSARMTSTDVVSKTSTFTIPSVANGANATVTEPTVSDYAKAQATLSKIQAAINNVSTQRSALGALQNRLEHTIANLDNVAENTQAAESRIRDTDMASEMVEYSKNNILAQAGQSMLAQANQSTQGVLSLLG